MRERADDLGADLTAWRRELHRYPELGYDVARTAAFVAGKLEELGIEFKSGIAETGIAGILRAPKRGKRAVLLRADMDALPIQEVPGREYGSTVDGRMHACGHDGHTAMLLGAAKLLTEQRERLTRDVVFCFQPAEEGQGGGERMVREGVLELVETGSVFAIHLWSPFEAGTIHLRPGPVMAAQDEFTARFIGRGGHGALPHAAIDPIVAAAQAVVALQGIVSRSVDPLEAAVVTVGSLQAGSASNVIPDDATLIGTLRSFDDGVRQLLRDRVGEVLEGVGGATRCRLDYELRRGYPAVVNNAAAVQAIREVAADVFGTRGVVACRPLAAAEDFAYFLEQRPGAFMLVGAGNAERGITAPHHSPEFDIDESVLPRGAELFARIALCSELPGD